MQITWISEQVAARMQRGGRLVLTLMLAVGMVGCAEETEPAEYGEAGQGMEEATWTPLFDGTSTAQWRGIGQDSIPAQHWVVEDGTLHKVASGNVPVRADGQPQQGGDIMTLDTYDDFELEFEFKVAEGANSGIKYNVSEDMSINQGGGNALGFEYQILDDERHPDAKAGVGGNRTTAGLYDLMAPNAQKQMRPPGEWNQGKIVFDGNHGEHWLNGVKVLEYDLGTPQFDSLLAASKYAPIEGFADRRAGHIVLQDHNDDVWYRNIRIREL